MSEKQTGPQRVHSATNMYIMRIFFFFFWLLCLSFYLLTVFINLFNYLVLFSSCHGYFWVKLAHICNRLWEAKQNCVKCLLFFFQGVTCPHEAEFRAYDILLNLNEGDILR